MKYFTSVALTFLALSQVISCTRTYVYEFGNDVGEIIYQGDGTIPLLRHVTDVNIPVPAGAIITYVKVTVDAISPPKVDYHSENQKISIVYSLTQLCLSDYTITVKAVKSY
ncbi:unnamed protein product [Euphydryas editha]|uniref:Uncharacterized protein n=1 Tax=Euphydryas editha TaxID=104508 RepID=A0AAU9U5R2_EUPED|nr:unnamed protein product [Euphydryas editha]